MILWVWLSVVVVALFVASFVVIITVNSSAIIEYIEYC